MLHLRRPHRIHHFALKCVVARPTDRDWPDDMSRRCHPKLIFARYSCRALHREWIEFAIDWFDWNLCVCVYMWWLCLYMFGFFLLLSYVCYFALFLIYFWLVVLDCIVRYEITRTLTNICLFNHIEIVLHDALRLSISSLWISCHNELSPFLDKFEEYSGTTQTFPFERTPRKGSSI